MLSYLIDFLAGNVELTDFLMYACAIAIIVFCATPLHEFAHALAADKLGDDTPRLRGRLTINPTAHIDVKGAVLLLLFGFGYAKPVEVRMRKFKKPKRDMALVALAGPVCNLLQAFAALFIYNALYYVGIKNGNTVLTQTSKFFLYAAIININLAVFNFLPVPPLDGSRLVTALLPSKYYYKLMQYERYIMIGLFLLLFTGILSVPLNYISSLLLMLLQKIARIPFV